MSRKIYYKSEVMDEVNNLFVDKVTEAIYGTMSNERKISFVQGMLALRDEIALKLKDELDEN